MSEHQCDTCGKYLFTKSDATKHRLYEAVLKDNDALRAENERLKQDAKRYRWITETANEFDTIYVPRIGKWIRLEDLGAVIDAALAAGGE